MMLCRSRQFFVRPTVYVPQGPLVRQEGHGSKNDCRRYRKVTNVPRALLIGSALPPCRGSELCRRSRTGPPSAA